MPSSREHSMLAVVIVDAAMDIDVGNSTWCPLYNILDLSVYSHGESKTTFRTYIGLFGHSSKDFDGFARVTSVYHISLLDSPSTVIAVPD